MPDILEDFSEEALVKAICGNMPGYLRGLLGSPHLREEVEFRDRPEILYTLTDIPEPVFNEALRARLTSKNADRFIKTIVERAAARKVPLYWWITPTDTPDDLEQRLRDQRFICVNTLTGMAADLQTLPEAVAAPPDLTINRVKQDSALRGWLNVIERSFGYTQPAINHMHRLMVKGDFAHSPIQQNYSGQIGEQTVASASLITGAGVAGVYSVATQPGFRRRGIGAAMTLHALHAAREAGYRIGVLQSTEAGQGIYERLGFKAYCTIRLYLWLPEVRLLERALR